MNDDESTSLAGLIVRPHHCGICVEDFDAALAFFSDIVGMQVEGEADHRDEQGLGIVVGLPGAVIRWALLELNGFRVELFRYYNKEGRTINIRQSDRGITHLGFEVNDTDEVCRRIRAAGYDTFSEPQDLRGGVTRPVYVHGPEGVVVEFLEIRS